MYRNLHLLYNIEFLDNRWKYLIAKKLIFDKIHQALGLDQAISRQNGNPNYPTTISGAAPLNIDTFMYFQSIDILLPELFGCSETSGPSTTNMTGEEFLKRDTSVEHFLLLVLALVPGLVD